MKKKYIISGIAASGLLIFLLTMRGESEEKQATMRNGTNGYSYPTARLTDVNSEYVLENIARGEIDLTAELVRLRYECIRAGVTERYPCNERIRRIIANLASKDKYKLLDLLEQYLAFEEKITQGNILPEHYSSLSETEKYLVMKKARLDTLGEQNTKLLFGLQEARISLTAEQKKFSSPEYTSLPAEERVRLYNDRKMQILGVYYETAVQREPAESKLATEIELNESDISRMSEAEQEQLVHDLRIKYFGPAETQHLEEEDAREKQMLAARNIKVDQFIRAEEDYLAQNEHLSDDERRIGIDALRESILGK